MSPLVKHLFKIRNKSIWKGDNEYLQSKIDVLIRQNTVRAVKNENGKNASGSNMWRDTVNRITGRKANQGSSNIDPSIINSYFQKINTDDNYTPPEPVLIPSGTRLPKIGVSTVQKLLAKQKKTSVGPDGLLYRIWKDFSILLAPTITKIFNMSLEHQCVPQLWKLANLNPIPKETLITDCTQLMGLFEKVMLKKEISP